MVKKNLSLSLEVNDGAINLVENAEKKIVNNINISDPAIAGLYEATKAFVTIMIVNEGKVGVNSLELSVLIKEVLEFAQSYKQLVGEKKKELVITLLKHIVEKEVNESDLNETLKTLILSSVDNIIDPAIELAIYVAKGNIKINKKALKKSVSKICPCLTLQ